MIEIKLRKDRKGSECASCDRFTIGKPKDDISGGIFVKKGTKIPNNILLVFPVDEEEGVENAKC